MNLEAKITNKIKRELNTAINRKRENKKSKSLFSLKESEPVIVLGNQKTGSTAIAALLSQATEKSVTLDILDAMQEPSWQLIYKYQLRDFSDFICSYENDFKKDIIKEPSLTFFYKELLHHLPKAKYVMIVRDPFENIRSILNRLGIPGDLEKINFDDWSSLKNFRTWRLALDSTWLGFPSETYIEALAYRWCAAADVYLNNKDAFNLVRYEDFKLNKKNSIEIIAFELGLSVLSDISDQVDIQFQGKGNTNSRGLEFFGLKNYQIIEGICGPRMSLLSYKIEN